MSPPDTGPRYTLRSVQQLLGLSRAVVARLVDAGFVVPTRGTRNEHRFSFQDLVLLRTAHSLQRASVAPRKIVRALAKLQAHLPASLPLSGLRIVATGGEVVVRDRLGPWEPDSGQWLIDFEVAPTGGAMSFLTPAAAGPISAAVAADPAAAPAGADDWFRQGEELEACDCSAAEHAYRRAIELAPGHVDACLNLGAMWCLQGRSLQARELYERAVMHCPDEALLHYNLGIALEEQQRPIDAVASYERCLALSPQQADAHYNAARLLEQLGDHRRALRHFSAYRRLQRVP